MNDDKDGLTFKDPWSARWFIGAQVLAVLGGAAALLVGAFLRNISAALIVAAPAALAAGMLQFIVFRRMVPKGSTADRSRVRISLMGAGTDKDAWLEAADVLGHAPKNVLRLRVVLEGIFIGAIGLMFIILRND